MALGDTFRHVRAGERLRFSAAAYNAMIDAAKAERDREKDLADDSVFPARAYDVLVTNDTLDNVARFGVLAVNDPATTPAMRLAGFQDNSALSGTAPVAADFARFAIMLESVRPGGVGRGRIVGPVVCQVALLDPTDVDDAFADVADGETAFLQGAARGAAKILWIEPVEDREDPDLPWCVVSLGGFAPGDFFEVTVTRDGGVAGSDTVDCSWTYEVKSLAGKVVGTGMTPDARRFPLTTYTDTPDNSRGFAYYDTNGLLRLANANELPALENCGGDGSDFDIIDGES